MFYVTEITPKYFLGQLYMKDIIAFEAYYLLHFNSRRIICLCAQMSVWVGVYVCTDPEAPD